MTSAVPRAGSRGRRGTEHRAPGAPRRQAAPGCRRPEPPWTALGRHRHPPQGTDPGPLGMKQKPHKVLEGSLGFLCN